MFIDREGHARNRFQSNQSQDRQKYDLTVQSLRQSSKDHRFDLRMSHAAQGAFVVTFGRAGEDKKFSKLGDVEATLQGFAGADYDLQVCRTV